MYAVRGLPPETAAPTVGRRVKVTRRLFGTKVTDENGRFYPTTKLANGRYNATRFIHDEAFEYLLHKRLPRRFSAVGEKYDFDTKVWEFRSTARGRYKVMRPSPTAESDRGDSSVDGEDDDTPEDEDETAILLGTTRPGRRFATQNERQHEYGARIVPPRPEVE